MTLTQTGGEWEAAPPEALLFPFRGPGHALPGPAQGRPREDHPRPQAALTPNVSSQGQGWRGTSAAPHKSAVPDTLGPLASPGPRGPTSVCVTRAVHSLSPALPALPPPPSEVGSGGPAHRTGFRTNDRNRRPLKKSPPFSSRPVATIQPQFHGALSPPSQGKAPLAPLNVCWQLMGAPQREGDPFPQAPPL